MDRGAKGDVWKYPRRNSMSGPLFHKLTQGELPTTKKSQLLLGMGKNNLNEVTDCFQNRKQNLESIWILSTVNHFIDCKPSPLSQTAP
jgi:hypothetical protein